MSEQTQPEIDAETLDRAQRQTGFIICTFPPEEDEDCERCKQPSLQLYFRSTDPYSSDGEYFCAPCVISESVPTWEECDEAAERRQTKYDMAYLN